MPIPLISKIKPQNNAPIPMYDDIDAYGGFQVRNDEADRDNIPVANRKPGMMVYTVSDGYFWQLYNGITNSDWAILPISGGSPVFFNGDISGNDLHQFVIGLQGISVSNEFPEDGYVLTYDAFDGYWKPAITGVPITFGGDLEGDAVSQTVVGLQMIPVSSEFPTDGYVLMYDATDGYWRPAAVVAGSSFDGVPSNHYGGTGNVVAIPATETVLGSDTDYTATSSSAELTTSDTAWHTILTHAPDANTTSRWQVTIVSQDASNNGDTWSAHIDFHVVPTGIFPSAPSLINVIYTGAAGTNYSAQAFFSGGNVVVQVKDSVSATVNWAAWVQDLRRS